MARPFRAGSDERAACVWFAGVVVLSIACGCSSAPTPPPTARLRSSAPVVLHASASAEASTAEARATLIAAAPSPPEPARVEGEEVSDLEVPGFLPAVVRAPVGETAPRPVVVATHGNFDRPEWQCEVWSRVFRGRVFVLCPRGTPANVDREDPRFTYPSGVSLEKEIDAGLSALRASPYGAYLADGPPVYASFSLGSILGVGIAIHRSKDFPELILVEGGLDRLDDAALHAFVRHGGARMMFVCAQGGCAGPAKVLANRLEDLGGHALVVDAGQVGHTYGGPVAAAVATAVPGFLQSDERFQDVFRD